MGRDPDKLFSWVRDNTYWVPYQGCLRGPIGVLMDRLGSSLDRALLLAELLRLSGQNVRLAHAQLPEQTAQEIEPKIRAVPKNPLPASPLNSKKETEEVIAKLAKEFKLNANQLHEDLDGTRLQAAKMAENAAQRVTEQTPAIAKAIGIPSDKDAKTRGARQSADRIAALRDHWWVQQQGMRKIWVDLDPLLPDARQTIRSPPH